MVVWGKFRTGILEGIGKISEDPKARSNCTVERLSCHIHYNRLLQSRRTLENKILPIHHPIGRIFGIFQLLGIDQVCMRADFETKTLRFSTLFERFWNKQALRSDNYSSKSHFLQQELQ